MANKYDEEWKNPFEKSLVEDWMVEKFPENYREMVLCFHRPDYIMDSLENIDIKIKVIMGGRGTGKSHVLRMLSIQSVLNDLKLRLSKKEITLEDYKKPYFGVYIKCDLFIPLWASNITYLSYDQIRTLFEHLFNLQVGIAIIDALKFMFDVIKDIPKEKENNICFRLCTKYDQLFKGNTFLEIINSLNNEIKKIQKAIKYLPWHKDSSKFLDEINFTSAPDFIVEISDIIREEVLVDKALFILLDEYDELDEYQQVMINRLVRTRRLVFRAASKINGMKTIEYTKGKELDEIHDFEIIPLHFEVSRENRGPYTHLLKNIFINRLKVYGNYKIRDPKTLLPSPSLHDEKITDKEIQKEFEKIRRSLSKKREIVDPERYWKNFKNHYQEAAIYRLLRKKRRDKLYAGFDEYVGLSSGIVRQFILLCRDAFSLANAKGINIERGEPMPIKMQSKAAEKVAKKLLYVELSKSIPTGYGAKIVRLIQDFGRILQAKLYYSTEPQANRFEILGSEKFNKEEYRMQREILENGLRMPCFLSEIAFKPKQPTYSYSFTFSLNWIFAPVLKIPPEKRWPTPIRVEELKDLCSDAIREEAIERIINQVRKRRRIVRGRRGRKKEPISRIKSFFEEPISLTNCPVTGHGCDQNLTRYPLEKGKAKAFLAISLDENSWEFDVRGWWKKSMTDNFGIRCMDVDDLPVTKGGFILCKICSCVRQMPMGLFEITELNPNVIFELGMATALNKLNFILVHGKKIPSKYKSDYPPKPLSGIEYIHYEYGENPIIKTIEEKIMPTINEVLLDGESQKCWVLRAKCPYGEMGTQPEKIFIGLPHDENPELFEEVEKLLKNMFTNGVDVFKPSQTMNELCQLCVKIKESSFGIVDTTNNNISMLFALGIAFGKDKDFIQLHNTDISPERPLSDLRKWAIEYRNLAELEKRLKEELPKRLRNKSVT